MESSSQPPQPPQQPRRVPQAVLKRDGDYVTLSHMDTATYLFSKHMPLQEAVKLTRFKFRFVFYDPEKRAEELAMEFVNACCADYADAQRRLKSVLHQFSGRDDDRQSKSRGSNGRPGYADK